MTPREEFLFELGRTARQIRSLTPDQEDMIRQAHVDGAQPEALARAYSVSRRTIYRTLERRHRPSLVARVGDYCALFEVGDEGPIQITEWVAAA